MEAFRSGVPAVRIADWLREGWEIFVSDAGIFILAALIYGLLSGLCFPILFGPLTCGMYIMIFDRMRGERAEIGRLFGGFEYFGQSFVAGLIYFALIVAGLVIVMVGFTLCVIPALIGIAFWIVVQTAFIFVFQLIVDRGMVATEAVAVSYNKIRENFGEFLLFGLVLWLISAAGSSVGFGFLLTVPLTFGATAAAYRDIFGLGEPSQPTSAI